ncbi:MAG: hypothetical protein H3C31_10050 [Brumimicrobium sp.]|nr:hypothetical protein [Brumimicrobium sp.]MCO5269597.1 hypothetical protein [Brumimicrobium sp.]
MSLTACKKDWTCQCTSDANEIAHYEMNKKKKAQADNDCKKLETDIYKNATDKWECEIPGYKKK